MRDDTRLRAFELADEVVLLIYRASREFPKEEMYGLTSQMRRAAVSVPSTIVERCTREGQAEYLRFLEIAFGRTTRLACQSAWGILRNMTFLIPNQKLWRPRRFWASCFHQCADNIGFETNSL